MLYNKFFCCWHLLNKHCATKSAFAFLVALPLSTSIFALDLAAALQSGYQSSESIQQSVLAQKTAKSAIDAVLSKTKPTLAASVSHSYTWKAKQDQQRNPLHTQSTRIAVDGQYDLYNAGTSQEVSVAHTTYLQAQKNVAYQYQLFHYYLASAYLAVLQLQDVISLLETQINQLATIDRQTREQFQAGTRTKLDVLATQAELAAVSAKKHEQEFLYDQALIFLEDMVGMSTVEVIALRQGTVYVMPVNSKEYWVDQAINHGYIMQLLQLDFAVANKKIAIAESKNSMRVQLTAGVSQLYNPNTAVAQQFQSTVGITVTYPLYTGGATTAAIQQAEYSYQSTSVGIAEQKLQKKRGVYQTYNDMQLALIQIRSLEMGIQAKRDRVELMRLSVLSGTRDQLDLLTAQEQYFDVSNKRLLARYNFVNKYFYLLLLAGQLDQEQFVQRVNAWFDI